MSEKPTDFSGKYLHFGLGNASMPLTWIARYAFRRTMQDGAHEYIGGGTSATRWGHRWSKMMASMADYFPFAERPHRMSAACRPAAQKNPQPALA